MEVKFNKQDSTLTVAISGNIDTVTAPQLESQLQENISDDRIAVNMINSFLGRMHLASHLDRMSEHQIAIIKEGVEYYNSLTTRI